MLTPGSRRCVAGVDIGSTLTKVVVHNGTLLASAAGRTEADYVRAAARLLALAMARAARAPGDLACVVATGYGRRAVPFADRETTEITCHARGVREIFPVARAVIDIGGQDAKGIKLGPAGKVVGFVMNDKCAAGTGRFLEVMAASLGLTLEELGARGDRAAGVGISSVCTVFAEQEVAQRLAEGVPLEEVLAGLHAALASRVARMVRSLRIEPPVVLTGGCARNPALRSALEARLGTAVLVPSDPLLTGALGAALLAAEALERGDPRPAGARRAEALARAGREGPGPPGPAGPPALATHRWAAPRLLDGQFPLPPGAPAGPPRGGLDAGALYTKAAVVAGDHVGFAIVPSEGDHQAAAGRALRRALERAGLPREALAALAATGLGAAKVHAGDGPSEVACLAAGAARLFPEAAQAIDIGGHGTRVVRLGPGGTVRDFAVTGQCAAGSARVLEVVAHLVGHAPGELGAAAARSRAPAPFSAGCAVFAETEAISLLARGTTPEDLLAGLHQAMAEKILAMVRASGAPGPSALAGGGARDAGLTARLGAALGAVRIPPEPMVVGALGAALLAAAGPR